jgi:hypothetical protein
MSFEPAPMPGGWACGCANKEPAAGEKDWRRKLDRVHTTEEGLPDGGRAEYYLCSAGHRWQHVFHPDAEPVWHYVGSLDTRLAIVELEDQP